MLDLESIQLGRTVRVYPLPYVNFRLGHNHLLHVSSQVRRLGIICPELRSFQLRLANDRMITSMAFADVYDKEKQFLGTDLESFRYDRRVDFTHGKKKIKIVRSRVNSKWENTGPRTEFKCSGKTVRASEADWFILAAYNLPNVQFLGWLTKEDMESYIMGWTAKAYASSPKLRSMGELSIEKTRRKGVFV